MKHLLFIDPEQRILEGLKHVFRNKREMWQATFCTDPRQAMRLIEEEPLDLVMTESQLPDSSGREVLERTRDRQPDAIRMIYSGEVELQRLLQTAPVAHQSLTKPSRPTTVYRVVCRALEIHESLGSDLSRKLVAGAKGLPTVPGVYSSLVCALANPNTSLEEVTEIVQQDVAICANILKLVNSALFGLSRDIRSVAEAVRYLGPKMLRNIVLSEEIMTMFEDADIDDVVRRVQLHSRITARIGADLLDDQDLAREAFLAGMLHDIGTLLLSSHKELEELRTTAEPTSSIVRPKEPILGHDRLGAYLLGLWGLPTSIVDAVAVHESPPLQLDESARVPAALHVADRIASQLAPCKSDDMISVARPRAHCLELLGLTRSFDELLSSVADNFSDELSANQPRVRP